MGRKLITDVRIVDAEKDIERGWVIIDNDRIEDFGSGEFPGSCDSIELLCKESGNILMPGVIDEHVHFREPGMTHKGSIESESAAAAAGGVTTFFDMPNTNPPTTCLSAWEDKMERASRTSVVNYAFFIAATPDNLSILSSADYGHIPGIKLFMGATTGAASSAGEDFLDALLKTAPATIAVHAEDEETINRARAEILKRHHDPDVCYHSLIRNADACYIATAKIVGLAEKYSKRVHVMHLSTAKELQLLHKGSVDSKLITAETCPQYLFFSSDDYSRLGTSIKCNPSVKSADDRAKLIDALFDGTIDTVATDHAPHLPEEKQGNALTAASGMPGVQFALPLMLQLAVEKCQNFSTISRLMSANPATVWGIDRRGLIRPGFYADLALISPVEEYEITASDVMSLCGWAPYIGMKLNHTVKRTFVNGTEAYNSGQGIIQKKGLARAIDFKR